MTQSTTSLEQPLSQPVPDRLWLLDLGSGDIVWSAERDPDGEQVDAVEYVRASTQETTIAELVAALEGLLAGVHGDGYVLPAGAVATARARTALTKSRSAL
jgi:hypothetical protein